MKLQFPLICLITPGEGRSPGLARDAAAAGIDLVQIRERTLESGALLDVVNDALAESSGTSCQIVVNDRFDVALAAGAAGVHLRADSISGRRIRSVAPPGFLVGRSVHTVEEALAASREGGCDYLIFGTVFPSRSKPSGHPVAGLGGLADVCRSTTLPVIAVGGISLDNAADAIGAGAQGIAAIDLFRDGTFLRSTVARLRQLFDS